jgi:hypothetical protein
MDTMLWALVIGVICAFACSSIAKSKNRNASGWAVGGFLFGIFALVLLLILPSLPGSN